MLLLLLADILSHLSAFLQTKNLIYGDISRKAQQLQNSLQAIQENNGHLKTLCSTTLLSKGGSVENWIEKFWLEIKTPFLQDLMLEIDLALKINEVLLAFNMFNTKTKFSEETWIKLQVLKTFYTSTQCSIFQNKRVEAKSIIEF